MGVQICGRKNFKNKYAVCCNLESLVLSVSMTLMVCCLFLPVFWDLIAYFNPLQIYSIVHDRTTVDRALQAAANDNKIRMFAAFDGSVAL